MITNLWNMISIRCGCHGDRVIPMIPHEGSGRAAQGGAVGSVFYSCPKYYPENREENERACFCRISITEYEEMVLKLSSVLEEAEALGRAVNLAGLSWVNKRGTRFTVKEHGKRIRVSVVSRAREHRI